VPDLDGLVFVKRGKSLVPADIQAEEWLDATGEGKEVLMSGRRPRNPRFHRLAFALMRLVMENDPENRWLTENDLLEDLKFATRHIETHINGFTGLVEVRTKSISFTSMDEFAFHRWFARATYVLATQILNTVPDELRDEVLAMVDGKKAA
jgi:hypothetical protein